MTEHRKPTNPLMARPAGNLTPRAERGTDFALSQLQAHCDVLNALNGGRDGWHVVGPVGQRTVAKARG